MVYGKGQLRIEPKGDRFFAQYKKVQTSKQDKTASETGQRTILRLPIKHPTLDSCDIRCRVFCFFRKCTLRKYL